MIKKIIVLAISFVLTLGSVIYTGTTTDAVSYGSGTGVSRTITSVDELTSLLSKLPDVSVYDENANVTNAEGYSDFKGITIVENGESSKYYNYKTGIRLDDNEDVPENEIEYFFSRKHDYTNKRLEMYFAVDCIYYHSIGTTWNTTEFYRYDLGSEYLYMDSLKAASGYATDFDIEVFYSKDKILFKINKNERYYQEAVISDHQSGTGYPKYKKAEEPKDEDEDDEVSDEEMYAQLGLKALNENLGVWVELDREATGVDGMDPDFDSVENMTPEQQQEYMLNLIVSATLSELSYQQVESIKQANALNFAYLTRVASFINETITDSNYYEVNGGEYRLNNWYSIPGYRCTYCGAFYKNEVSSCSKPKCSSGGNSDAIIESMENTYEPLYSYINALTGWGASNGNNGGYSYTASFQFGFGLNNTIKQRFGRNYNNSNYPSSRSEEEYVSNSTIYNVDNTVVNVLKKSKVKTLEETFGKSLRKSLSDLLSQQGGNN